MYCRRITGLDEGRSNRGSSGIETCDTGPCSLDIEWWGRGRLACREVASSSTCRPDIDLPVEEPQKCHVRRFATTVVDVDGQMCDGRAGLEVTSDVVPRSSKRRS